MSGSRTLSAGWPSRVPAGQPRASSGTTSVNRPPGSVSKARSAPRRTMSCQRSRLLSSGRLTRLAGSPSGGAVDASVSASVMRGVVPLVDRAGVRHRFLNEVFLSAVDCRLRPQDRGSGVARGLAQLLLDADELVVFCRAVAAGEAAGLDLAAVGGDCEVGDGGVLGLTGPVAHNGAPAGPLGEFHGLQRLGQGADLVDLDQDGVGR